ncbi:hypothetical protein SRABI128_05161 [Microbacterium sp. Bi128]|nr:hypothetical protein SRABI128_05161 [Microbacterium sp. Bi128]
MPLFATVGSTAGRTHDVAEPHTGEDTVVGTTATTRASTAAMSSSPCSTLRPDRARNAAATTNSDATNIGPAGV